MYEDTRDNTNNNIIISLVEIKHLFLLYQLIKYLLILHRNIR